MGGKPNSCEPCIGNTDCLPYQFDMQMAAFTPGRLASGAAVKTARSWRQLVTDLQTALV